MIGRNLSEFIVKLLVLHCLPFFCFLFPQTDGKLAAGYNVIAEILCSFAVFGFALVQTKCFLRGTHGIGDEM